MMSMFKRKYGQKDRVWKYKYFDKNKFKDVLRGMNRNENTFKHASDELKRNTLIAKCALSKNGNLLAFMPFELQDDEILVRLAIESDGNAMQYASDRLKQSPELWLLALEHKFNRFDDLLKSEYKELMSDKSFVHRAVELDWHILRCAFFCGSFDPIQHSDTLLAAIAQSDKAFKYVPSILKQDEIFMIQAMRKNNRSMFHLSHHLLSNRSFMMKIVQVSGRAFGVLYRPMKLDREFAVEAVKQNPSQYHHIGDHKNDIEIAMLSVTQHPYSKYPLLSETLQANPSMASAAVRNCGLYLQKLQAEFQHNREIVSYAVAHDGLSLCFASEELRKDRAIVLQAVRQEGTALRYALDPALCDDFEIVYTAVKSKGIAIRYASQRMKENILIVFVALSKSSCAKYHISEIYRKCFPVFVWSWYLRFPLGVHHFLSSFLIGWLGVGRKNTSMESASQCKLPMLNQLGKYGSILVKKLIADYSGVQRGELWGAVQSVVISEKIELGR